MAKDIVLALGGGGFRGIAHLGVIRCLEENGYTIRAVSGSSAGSLIGGLYAAGVSVEAMDAKVREFAHKPDFGRSGSDQTALLGTSVLENIIQDLVGDPNLDTLPIPFAATATLIDTGESLTIQDGSLVDAILTSCAIPGVFPVRQQAGHPAVDGAVVKPVPVEAARRFFPALPVVAVALNRRPEGMAPTELLVPFMGRVPKPLASQMERSRIFETGKLAMRSFQLMMDKITDLNLELEKPDVAVFPEVGQYPTVDDVIPDGLQDLGYAAMEAKLPVLEESGNLLNSYRRIMQYSGSAKP